MNEGLETTFYRFYSEVRSFLSKLITNPMAVQPSEYLQERKFNKTKLINLLIKRGVLERHESIKDSTNSDYEKPTYTVQYKVRKKNFERNIKRLYIRFFERNIPGKEKEQIDEDGATGCCSVGSYAFDVPVGGVMRKSNSIYNPKGLNEGKRKIYITESQYKYIQNIINSVNAADEDIL